MAPGQRALLPPEALGEGLKDTVLRLAGSPERFGAQVPDPDIFAAGITQSHGFLPAVAEGRIVTKPWIEEVAGRTVRFADGTSGEFDAILLGTGYRLSLPWLAPDVAAALGLDGTRIDLHAHSFHPDLTGLAFVGLYDLVGPLSAGSFRLSGPDALPDAPERTREAAAAFGRIGGQEFEPEEQGLRDLVRGTLPQAA